ncbi:MAG: conjugal transfer protein TraG [Candidatus Manganitrophaceae bacterium]|nr:MAG: conjugal transfer protein TraG [Candidatus Manganitrophaceae bacterium]
MRKSFKKSASLIPLSILLLAALAVSPAYAMEMEYYTYNGFDAVVSAFSKIALIFSDDNYEGLLFTITVLGILLGAVVVYFLTLSGVRISLLSWAWPVGIGITLYLALIIPKGTLHIYDPVKNQYQPVGGIPDGLVAVIGAFNKIERGLVDIVATAADPVGFQRQAGGVGFDMLHNLHSKGVLLLDQYLHQSLKKYVEDCVYFELARPGATLTVNQLAGNTDFLPLFEQASNPAIYTVYYEDDPSNPDLRRGVTQTCAQAFIRIRLRITNPGQFEATSRSRCAEAGFDPAIPAEYNQCRSMLSDLVSWFEGAAFDTTQIFRQTVIAHTISDVVLSSSPDTAVKILASRDAGSSMLSAGVMANEWIPIIRAVTTAMAVGLLPLLVLFIPTPLFGKAATLIAGFFVWLTAWGVTDAIAHQFAVDYAVHAFEQVRQYQLGLAAVSSFGTASLKTLAAFGAIRWSGLMLATVITTMLVRFGGHALSMLAGDITSGPQRSGQSAGRLATPEGQSAAVRAAEESPPVMSNAHKFDFAQRIDAKTNTIARSVGEGLGWMNADAAFEGGVISGQSARGSAMGTEHFATDVAGGDVVSASMQSQYFKQSSHYGGSKGRFDQAHQVFGIQTPAEAAAFESTGRLITPKMAATAAGKGYQGVIPGMRLTEIGFDPKSGSTSAMSFAGPVTEENIGALKEIASNAGHKNAAAMLKPGMVATYSINPQTGKGTFGATDTTSVKSEGFHEETFENGLTVDTPHGSYKFKNAKVQNIGGQLYVNGTTEDDKHVQLKGTEADVYRVVPGLKTGTDGTAHYSADPDAAMYELQTQPTDSGNEGGLRTSRVKDRNGETTSIGLNLTSGDIGKGVRGEQTLNPEELKNLVSVLRSQGAAKNAVNTLEYLAEQGKSAQVKYTAPVDGGGVGHLEVRAGGFAHVFDFSSSLSGTNIRKEDINTNMVDHGVRIGSAMQMALDRKPQIARFVSDHTLNKYDPQKFDANVAETAKDLAKEVGGYVHRSGASAGFAEGSTGVVIFGMGGVIGRKSTEGETVNLLAAEYDRKIRQSVGEAKTQGLGREETERYVAGKIGDFTQSLYDQARRSSSSNYGADAPREAIKREIESGADEGRRFLREQGLPPAPPFLKLDPKKEDLEN